MNCQIESSSTHRIPSAYDRLKNRKLANTPNSRVFVKKKGHQNFEKGVYPIFPNFPIQTMVFLGFSS
ncbi:hypothetical protein L1887_01342 [Cichorium endivia]|nr:hypothetical protein L1887_01342 [Cichorium endivia]